MEINEEKGDSTITTVSGSGEAGQELRFDIV
jgi:hypothetical protein